MRGAEPASAQLFAELVLPSNVPASVLGTLEMREMEIKRFQIDIPQAELDDLQERLARTRAEELPTDPDAAQTGPVPRGGSAACRSRTSGISSSAGAPRTTGEHEARLNAHPHFTTEIDGQTIHFVHARPTRTPPR